jgi:tetratricopeptide (TPR) repeat protein
MTEALITDLAKIRALRVISRTSVMRFKGTDKSIPQIARELDVDAIVEGSVVRAGDRLRVSAQLIHAHDDKHLWAESFERELGDVLTLQGELAQAIVREIQVKLTPQEEARLASARPVDPEAYEAYVKGRYHWNRRTDEDMQRGLACFQEAIDKDPGYALAYAGLADVMTLQGINGQVRPREVIPRARAAALRALELDNTLAEAHATLGFIHLAYDWDWSRGEKELQRALQLNAGYATARLYWAILLQCRGELDRAIEEIRQAQRLDPLAFMLNVNAARFLCWAGRPDEAIEEARKVLDLDPDFPYAHWALGLAYRSKGMYEEAIEEFRRGSLRAGSREEISADLGYTYGLLGMDTEARQLIEELERQSKERYIAPTIIARIYAGLADTDAVFEWLETACEERDALFLLLNTDPVYDGLRSDPRFSVLERKIGLEP